MKKKKSSRVMSSATNCTNRDDNLDEENVAEEIEETENDEEEIVEKKRKRKDKDQKEKEKKKEGKSVGFDQEDVFERYDFEVNQSVAEFVDEEEIGRNTVPESEDEDEDPIIERSRRIKRRRDDGFSVGTCYFTEVEFKEAVLDYALSTASNLKQDRWEKTKVGFRCAMPKCKWRVYCSYDEQMQMLRIKTTYSFHSCTPNGKCKMLMSPVIGRLFMDKLRLNGKLMPVAIHQQIREQWKLVASGNQCQRGRLLALKWLEEEYKQQFSHLRGYAKEIQRSNPGSTAIVDTYQNPIGEDVFNRFYVCFNNLRTHWAGTCRPILGLDGTFLKVAVKGCLLTAVGHDPNNQIYPVAWAVVQSETADNWLWFVKQLKVDLGLDDGSRFIILSDRSRGLISAVKNVLPNAEHRWCVKHIVENLKKNHGKKDRLKELVWRLAWSYNPRQFDLNLDEMRRYDLALYNDVMKEEPKTWSRAFFRIGSCCEDVDNNATESFNNTITKARAKSLVPMLETIRKQAMERIARRKEKSNKHQSKYSKYVVKLLASEKKDADRATTWRCTHGMFEVELDGQSHRVDLPKSTCTCGKWQISGIPCEHAYGACIEAGIDVENHVSGFFLTEMWRDCYEYACIPLEGSKSWMDSSYRLIVAPPEPEPPGRKKKTKSSSFNRIKGPNESPKKKKKKKNKQTGEKKSQEKDPHKETLGRQGRIVRCSKCKEVGHNAARCKKFPKEKNARKRKRDDSHEVGQSSAEGHDIIPITQPTQGTQANVDEVD